MTINSINSGYNLAQEIQKNTQNTTKEIPTSQNLPQDLVKDKSQAVKEVLGYGVDSEGFFTSDLNEAAGIPKDYRIEAEKIKQMVEMRTRDDAELIVSYSTHTEIDIAKTIANIYDEFANFLDNETNQKYFSDNFYNNTNYTINEILQDKKLSKGEKIKDFFTLMTTDVAMEKQFIVGKPTLIGKIFGYDKSISKGELKQFYSFMESNKIGSILTINKDELPWGRNFDMGSLDGDAKYINLYTKNSEIINMANELYMDYKALIARNDISLEEFKSEYIKFKERHDEFMEKYRNMPEEDKLYPNGDEKREFKTFQVTSKSETYKDIDFLNALDFIKSQQKLEQILLLFGEESKGNLDIKDLKKYFASPNRLDTEA